MRYISLFSGVGGLEHPTISPSACCEIDLTCHTVLSRRTQTEVIHDDVTTYNPPRADAVVGGFPCQDLSVAGKMAGLNGKHSGLFFQMLRVAKKAKADHMIVENVPNLLRLESGDLMRTVIHELAEQWKFIAWRSLNAREFGLPQQRKRVIIVASKSKSTALNLFRRLKIVPDSVVETPSAAGFYTTAGSRSICYSMGYVPTLKVGSSLSIPGPPGIHTGRMVRKATATECLALQGFKSHHFSGITQKDIFRQMGNAVPVPLGAFALRTITKKAISCRLEPAMTIGPSGFYDGSLWAPSFLHSPPLATNLEYFLESSNEELSERSASGLVRRLRRSGTKCPADLFDILCELGGGGLALV